jgi:hypothetical protein
MLNLQLHFPAICILATYNPLAFFEWFFLVSKIGVLMWQILIKQRGFVSIFALVNFVQSLIPLFLLGTDLLDTKEQ